MNDELVSFITTELYLPPAHHQLLPGTSMMNR